MNFLFVPLLFLIWRIFDFLIIFISQKIIPYLGFFPYRNQLPGFNLPAWISALANFDGLHYISIARNGYAQYEQAFFPLYPLTIKLLNSMFANNQLLTGIIISNVSFFIGLWILSVMNYGLRINKKWLLIFLLVFPTSFFFGAVYTEGLFFLLLILTLYFLKKERFLLVAVFAFLASLTRLVGVFLIIPIGVHLFVKYQKSKIKDQKYILNIKNLILLMPLLGLGIYCFYLFKTTGDPLFFLTSQPIFGANRSSHLIVLPQVYWRYFKIFFTASHDFQFYISMVEFFIFNFVFFIVILNLFQDLKRILKRVQYDSFDKIGLGLFSLANILLPTLTGTFSSIPRYSLFSISIFIYLSQIKNNFIKFLILGVFLILHILLLGYFAQGYFVS